MYKFPKQRIPRKMKKHITKIEVQSIQGPMNWTSSTSLIINCSEKVNIKSKRHYKHAMRLALAVVREKQKIFSHLVLEDKGRLVEISLAPMPLSWLKRQEEQILNFPPLKLTPEQIAKGCITRVNY